MDLNEVRREAKGKLKGYCGVYKVCDGDPSRLCMGLKYGDFPGMGGAGSGTSFRNNFMALDAVRLKMRVVGEPFDVDTSFRFFSKDLAMPIMGASTSGTKYSIGDAITEGDLSVAVVNGCKEAGSIGWRGDGAATIEENPNLEACQKAGGHGVQIFKPVEQGLLLSRIKDAEERGILATGVDLDGFGSQNMAKIGYPVFRKSVEDLKEIVRSTKLPVIFKGIMTVEDADSVMRSGAAALVVSNHGGRVLDHTPGTAEVLPAIVDHVDGNMPVYVDGAVRSGWDALKMMALGADGVLIGRDLVRAAVGGGAEGVRLHMEFMQKTLVSAMRMTDCPDLRSIGPRILA
jgi:isopentenyl diphosphate isomerase/L-lactate dehydrogenase-like FMN-dependent dehydrogenase